MPSGGILQSAWNSEIHFIPRLDRTFLFPWCFSNAFQMQRSLITEAPMGRPAKGGVGTMAMGRKDKFDRVGIFLGLHVSFVLNWGFRITLFLPIANKKN